MTASRNYRVISHPVISHKMAQLRDKETPTERFRTTMRDLSRLMAYELTRDLAVKTTTIETPLEKTEHEVLSEDFYLISILRAGNGMLEGFLDMVPQARTGHIGIYRDKFINNTVEYFFKIPKGTKESPVTMVDPMLATGATAVAAIDRLKEYGVGQITLACIVASPEGLATLQEHHPDVKVVALNVDRQLNEKGYILPGLGDAGDRLYGTMD